jgi:hypothetical protein
MRANTSGVTSAMPFSPEAPVTATSIFGVLVTGSVCQMNRID